MKNNRKRRRSHKGLTKTHFVWKAHLVTCCWCGGTFDQLVPLIYGYKYDPGACRVCRVPGYPTRFWLSCSGDRPGNMHLNISPCCINHTPGQPPYSEVAGQHKTDCVVFLVCAFLLYFPTFCHVDFLACFWFFCSFSYWFNFSFWERERKKMNMKLGG